MSYDIQMQPVYARFEKIAILSRARASELATSGATVLMVEQSTIVPTGS